MENMLYYKKSAKYFEEALPLGNGRMGAMVFGGTKTERIALNEDSLWSGYPKDNNNKSAHEYLEKVRSTVFSGDIAQAQKLLNEDMHGDWSDAYLPFGDLLINYASKTSRAGYERRLDISKGVATVKFGDIKETVFVSQPAQLIVVNIKSENPFSCNISFASKIKHSHVSCKGRSLVLEGRAPEICYPVYYNTPNPVQYGNKGMKFTGIAKVLGEAKFSDGCIFVKNQKEITVLVSLATAFADYKSAPDANSFERAAAPLETDKGFGALYDEHVRDFESLFDRVEFKLEGTGSDAPTDKRLKLFRKGSGDNGLIALLYQYGRYLTISGSRPGTQATTLQGIWNDQVRAPWSSNYTVNINTQMNYWGTDAANLSECFEPLVALVEKLVDNGQKTARDYYDCPGSCAHHNTDLWGCTQPASNPTGKENCAAYSFWPMSLPWFLNMLYDHYLYTNDLDYRARITPLFEKVCEFYKAFLTEKDGELVTCPSISPENSYKLGDKRFSVTYMPSMDREMLHDFFNNCRELGIEAPHIAQVKPASDGRIPEWAEEFAEVEPEHRHLSHLYCIYPSSYPASEQLKAAADKSLEVRGTGGTGWSLAWKLCLRGRMQQPADAALLIKNQLRYVNPHSRFAFKKGGGTYPNLFCAHPPFQIDGNYGFTAGIGDLIAGGKLPEDWNGVVKGVKLRGGKTVNAKIQNGKLIPIK